MSSSSSPWLSSSSFFKPLPSASLEPQLCRFHPSPSTRLLHHLHHTPSSSSPSPTSIAERLCVIQEPTTIINHATIVGQPSAITIGSSTIIDHYPNRGAHNLLSATHRQPPHRPPGKKTAATIAARVSSADTDAHLAIVDHKTRRAATHDTCSLPDNHHHLHGLLHHRDHPPPASLTIHCQPPDHHACHRHSCHHGNHLTLALTRGHRCPSPRPHTKENSGTPGTPASILGRQERDFPLAVRRRRTPITTVPYSMTL
ncbi:hypothetical protein Dimus_022131, partial [Dionaea muscipula]